MIEIETAVVGVTAIEEIAMVMITTAADDREVALGAEVAPRIMVVEAIINILVAFRRRGWFLRLLPSRRYLTPVVVVSFPTWQRVDIIILLPSLRRTKSIENCS